MSVIVRNACVGRGHIDQAGPYLVYSVPAGNVLLLKSVVLLNGTSGSTTVTITVQIASGVTLVYLEQPIMNAGTGHHLQTWVALNPTDQLVLNTATAPVYYWVSGALLPTAAAVVSAGAAPAEAGPPTGSADQGQGVSASVVWGEPTPILLPPPMSIVSPA